MSLENANENSLYNVEIEKQVLGALLVKDGASIPEIAAILTADDFYRPEHQIIYKHILEVYDKYEHHVDMALLMEELRKGGFINNGDSKTANIDLEYLFALMQITVTNAYVQYHAQIVKDHAERRRAIENFRTLAIEANKGLRPIEDIAADAMQTLTNFSARKSETKRIKLAQYITEAFSADIDKENLYSDRKTGFNNLDALQNFLPGVYVIGAQPALGKTTFAWQLAENLATNGEYCIFCSYEMSRLEMACKSLARRAFSYDSDSTLSATDIRRKAFSENVFYARADIADSDINLDIMEMQNETVDELLALIRPLCKNDDKAPVVFIDYLQIMPSSNKKSSATKDELKISIDDTLRKLKVFQRDTGTTFFVISSFNRSNYNSTAAFEAFKESGGIEYSSDVIWALQLYAATNFKAGKSEDAKRKEIEKAKNQQPREMVLQCLKNRFGGNYNCYFNYYSKFDYFSPCEEADFIVNAPPEPSTDSDEKERF